MKSIIILLTIANILVGQKFSHSADFREQFLYVSKDLAIAKSIISSEREPYEDYYEIGIAKFISDPDLGSFSGDKFSSLLLKRITLIHYDKDKMVLHLGCSNDDDFRVVDIKAKTIKLINLNKDQKSKLEPISSFYDKHRYILMRKAIQEQNPPKK